jgi:hypothetical protein
MIRLLTNTQLNKVKSCILGPDFIDFQTVLKPSLNKESLFLTP